jgi:kynureninase
MARSLPLRDAFFMPPSPDAVELRAFTHGLMPRTVPAMMAHFADDWRQRGVDAWNEIPNHWRPASGDRVGWWSLPEYLGENFIAPLLAAPPDTCILQPNVHWTMHCLLSAPEVWTRGRRVVITEAEFPSVMHSLRRWQDVFDLDLHVVPLTDQQRVDPERVLEAITPETGLVVLSHVGFTTGQKLRDTTLRAVADATHAAGGLFVVDGYHSTGSVPIRVSKLDADVYMGGLLKEACGSSGNAFVYLRPGLDLSPRLAGWFGDADPFGFAQTPADHPDVRRRFMGGTTAVASMYHAVEGVRLLLDVGLEAVRAHSLRLTERALVRADEIGVRVHSPREPDRRSAMVILEVPAADRLCAYLKEQHFYLDSRKGRFLRMAPFVWNTADEVDRTLDAIGDALRDGSYHSLPAETTTAAGPVT